MDEKNKTLMLAGGLIFGVIIMLTIIFFFTMDSISSKTSATGEQTIVQKNPQGDDLVYIANKETMLKSTDNGRSFTPYFKIRSKAEIGQADVLSVTFHPVKSGDIMVSSFSDGLFHKQSDSDEWLPINFPPKQVYSFLIDHDSPDNILLASGVVAGNGRIFRTLNGGKLWNAVYGEPGDGTTVTAMSQDPKNPKIILAGTSRGTIIKSIDEGETWVNVGNSVEGEVRSIVFDSQNQLSAYLITYQNKVYYTSNGGKYWIDWELAIKNEIEGLRKSKQDREANALEQKARKYPQPESPMIIATDPFVSGRIYAGGMGKLYRSDTYGKFWTKINVIESVHQFPVKSLALNSSTPNEIIFAAGKAFYRTTNGGATWAVTPITTNKEVSFVVFDPFTKGTIFIGLRNFATKNQDRLF